MRVVLDTNVLVSGVFFGGVPRDLLEAWGRGAFDLVASPKIVDEYLRIVERLSDSHPGLEGEGVLARIIGNTALWPDPEVTEAITRDPDDDVFMALARDADAVVVSGDSDLLGAAGWAGVQVLKPRDLLDRLEG